MKTFKGLMLLLMLAAPSILSAQENVKKVQKMQEGTKLNKDDVDFLQMVTKSPANRGDSKAQASVGGKTFSEGYTLTKQDADMINAAAGEFAKENKGSKKPKKTKAQSRGAQACCYWMWWCDIYGNCRYWWRCVC